MNFAGEPSVLEITEALEEALEEIPQAEAIFVVWAREGEPYIGKTGLLRRRLKRLLRTSTQPSRLLNLRSIASARRVLAGGIATSKTLTSMGVARAVCAGEYLTSLNFDIPVRETRARKRICHEHRSRLEFGGAAGQYYGPFPQPRRSRGIRAPVP